MSFQFAFPHLVNNDENSNFEIGIGRLGNILIKCDDQIQTREGSGQNQCELKERKTEEIQLEVDLGNHLLPNQDYGSNNSLERVYRMDNHSQRNVIQEKNYQNHHPRFKEQYSQSTSFKKLYQKSKLFLSRPMQLYTPFKDEWETSQKSIEESIQQAIQLYQLHSIDSALLQSNLIENLQYENDLKRFDPFHGNRLTFHDKDRVLACPISKNLSELGVYSLNEMDCLSLTSQKPVETCQLKTPITQVIGINNHPSASFLLRSMEGIHFCRYTPDMDLALDEEGAYTLKFDLEPMHIAYNTHLSSQAAVMLPNAAVNIWDLESQTCYNWSQGGSEYIFQDHRDAWKICEFGAHPRTLLLSDRNFIKLGDLRTLAMSASSIFSITAEAESISYFARSEIRPFQVAVTTDKRCLLLDTRYPLNPLLEWKTSTFREPQNLVQFINHPLSNNFDCFYTWGKRNGDVLFYFYDSPNHQELPPCSQSIQKIESFWKHPLHTFDANAYPSTKSHQESLLNKFEDPGWPLLIGTALVPSQTDSSCFSFYQMDDTGALYTQVFSTKNSDVNEDDGLLPADEIQDAVLQESDKREGECLRKTLEIWSRGGEEMAYFESDHSIFDMKNLLEFCKKRIEIEMVGNNSKVLNETNMIPKTLISSRINSIYDYLSSDLLELDHKSVPRSLPSLSYHPSKTLLNKIHSDISASNCLLIEPASGSISNRLNSLPSSQDKFSPEMNKFATRVFSNDLELATTLCYPGLTESEVQFDDGTFESHQSQISSSFGRDSKTVKGISSWLLHQWTLNKRVEDYTDVDSSGYSSSEFSGTDTPGSVYSSSRLSQQAIRHRRPSRIRSIEPGPFSLLSSQKSQDTTGPSTLLDIASRLSQTNNPPVLLSQARSSQVSHSRKRKRMGGF